MGFCQCNAEGKGGYARLWSIDPKEKYTLANVSTFRRKPNSSVPEYETDFQDGFVRLIGAAHNTAQTIRTIPENGLPIQITSCEVQHAYLASTKRTYTNFVIWSFDILEENSDNAKPRKASNKSKSKASAQPVAVVEDDSDEEEDDEDLPF